MMVKEGVFFTQLSKYTVRDVNNKKIGHVGDLLLNKDDWSLNSFIIHGSFIEEKLEAMKLKEDIDPIVPKEFIDNEITVDKLILITKPVHLLAKTFTGWQPKDKVRQFSKLRKLKVFDENDEDVGRVIDILFHSDAVQAAGKVEINPQRSSADLLALSGHKIGGPHLRHDPLGLPGRGLLRDLLPLDPRAPRR